MAGIAAEVAGLTGILKGGMRSGRHPRFSVSVSYFGTGAAISAASFREAPMVRV